MLVAAGQAATAGVVSTEVLALTEGVMKTMLLSKLKGLWAVAVVVAVTTTAGLTYRAVAQETAKVRVGTALTARQAPDELEALRLEIEALRKEMRAMRERMKTLETKVQGQARDGVGQKEADEERELRRKEAERTWREQAQAMYLRQMAAAKDQWAKALMAEAQAKAAREQRAKEAASPVVNTNRESTGGITYPNRIHDPLADAEAALKRLRQNPNDKQAAEALEQALKRLKEQRKPNQPVKPMTPAKQQER
jgi:hypothetical protein